MPSNRGPREAGSGRLTLHELAIRGLVGSDKRICRNGFNQAVRALWRDLEIEWDEPDLDFRPDGYLIDRGKRELTIFEVGDWRLATHEKERRLGDFWFWWDNYAPEWTVRCIAINRFGRVSHEIDLSGLYLDSLAEFMPRYAVALSGRSQEKGGS